ncbi:MAG: Cytochrome C biogenesis protein transmembrane region [Bacteroidetes bacterium ADurb.Bin302]|jgi:cytochrome c-type biogenesis protein|nr:sulfite exporter TauE/SafE family protein [Bacteroidales bacterium]OQA46192.1 MAG: Cytochrome C biogenesis protein transmembrane region [Bacteroidetes bacterium ADurb.Bin302]
MEWIQQIIDSSNIPILIAFLLGLLTAVSPCPLATNITAIGYISKDIASKKRVLLNGLLYTLGKIIAYTLLGAILIYILREGASTFHIQKTVSKYGELFLPFILLLLGLFILFSDKIKLPSFGFKGNSESLKNRGGWGALFLGMLFALAFCPSSGVFYFGMLIPLSATSSGGYFLPAVFAFATALPVIIVAWIIAYSANSIGKFYGKMLVFQKWFNIVVGILCITIGIYYFVTIYL